MGFLKCLWWVVSRFFAVLAIASVISGLLADVPGLDETPAANATIGVISKILVFFTIALTKHPIECFFAVGSIALYRWLVITPHAENLRIEMQEKRAKMPSRNSRQTKSRRTKKRSRK